LTDTSSEDQTRCVSEGLPVNVRIALYLTQDATIELHLSHIGKLQSLVITVSAGSGQRVVHSLLNR